MAYTPINWAENLDVDATKLDKMDNQIDANEQRLTDIDNKATGTVTDNLQGQIDANEQRLTDIDNKATGTVTDNLQGQIDANEQDLRNIENDFANNEIIKKAYPVGSIYINANNGTNPSSLLGFGSWSRFGEGRVLVSQDSTDADFDEIGETGGEKEHQLTVDEIPSHSHSYIGSEFVATPTLNYGDSSTITTTNFQTTTSTGGDSPHNNLQPYITVYMWVRTA